MVSIPPMVVERTGRHNLPSHTTEGAALKQIELKEVATENCSSMWICEEKKQEVLPRLDHYR